MLVKIYSIVSYGVDLFTLQIEVNVSSRGFPSFDIVGLPGKVVSESKHRILTALRNSGVALPSKKIVVNLAPADIPKHGSQYDFPIALGLYSALTKTSLPTKSLFYGELSLDGSLCYTHGAFLLALHALHKGFRNVFVPSSCIKETSHFASLNVFSVEDLAQMFKSLPDKYSSLKIKNSDMSTSFTINSHSSLFESKVSEDPFENVYGQYHAKRAIEISIAGNHHIMLSGPPGSGKSLLAKRYKNLLPKLSENASLEVTKIYSISKKLDGDSGLIETPPFRSPHNTLSHSAMFGGGNIPLPGEVSLAHNGVLFLDEFTEFPRFILESLRQPFEDGYITISRTSGTVTYPSRFTLIASCNPCPCGFKSHPTIECTCTYGEIARFNRKLSGPILDRFDLFIAVPPVEAEDLSKLLSRSKKASVSNFKMHIEQARNLQALRYMNTTYKSNSDVLPSDIESLFNISVAAKKLLSVLATNATVSARSYVKLVKLSRTIADLAGSESISESHVSEALSYRY